MAGALQAPLGDTAKAEIRLLMRTGPLAGKHPLAVTDQQQADMTDLRTNDGAITKLRQRQNLNESRRGSGSG